MYLINYHYILLNYTSAFSVSFPTDGELFYRVFRKTFLILSAILLPIRSPGSSAVFKITFFEVFLSASVLDCFA